MYIAAAILSIPTVEANCPSMDKQGNKVQYNHALNVIPCVNQPFVSVTK